MSYAKLPGYVQKWLRALSNLNDGEIDAFATGYTNFGRITRGLDVMPGKNLLPAETRKVEERLLCLGIDRDGIPIALLGAGVRGLVEDDKFHDTTALLKLATGEYDLHGRGRVSKTDYVEIVSSARKRVERARMKNERKYVPRGPISPFGS